jgi:hypothetical protein
VLAFGVQALMRIDRDVTITGREAARTGEHKGKADAI